MQINVADLFWFLCDTIFYCHALKISKEYCKNIVYFENKIIYYVRTIINAKNNITLIPILKKTI